MVATAKNLLSQVRNPDHAAASLAPHLPTSAEFTNEPIRRHEFLFYLPGGKMVTKGGCERMNMPMLLSVLLACHYIAKIELDF